MVGLGGGGGGCIGANRQVNSLFRVGAIYRISWKKADSKTKSMKKYY